MRALTCLALLFAVACSKGENIPWDGDGDGVKNDVDCNDELSAVFPAHLADDGVTEIPAALELCNGFDDDCDGIIDNAATEDGFVYYKDADGDGTGSTETAVGCSPPETFVPVPGDCDDADPEVHPGKPEECNTVDDDCNGVVDDSLAFGTPFYPDEDRDGFGVTVSIVYLCGPQGGYVPDGGDCDDRSIVVFPGATEQCNELDDDCDGLVDDNALGGGVYYLDADGDEHGDPDVSIRVCVKPGRYTSDSTDCDDTDGRAFPGADERCNGADDDCNVLIDDEPIDGTRYYLDGDADGYGDPARTQAACLPPADYVTNALDCDDADDDYHPGVPEYCDEVDNDCNGVVDDGEALDGDTYYRDADDDGFGVPTKTVLGCYEPDGYAAVDTDCNDKDASVSPEALEVCNNGVDDNCNDSADSCGISGDIDIEDVGVKISAESGYSRYFGAKVDAGDLDGDGYEDLAVWEAGYYTYTSSGYPDNYGRIMVYYGPLNDDRAETDAEASVVQGYGMQNVYLDMGGDYDGDGGNDLVMGMQYYGIDYTTFTYDYSGAWVGYSGTDILGDIKKTDTPTFIVHGDTTNSYAGYTLASVGDVNGDGVDDLALGDYNYAPSSSSYYYGAIGLFYGPISGDMKFKEADLLVTGNTNYDQVGSNQYGLDGLGDFDGDGQDDFVYVHQNESTSSNHYGTAYIVCDPAATGTFKTVADTKITRGTADTEYSYLYGGSGVGDVDGDGYTDVMVGSPYEDSYQGTVYLVPGGTASATLTLDADATASISGSNRYEYFGQYPVKSVGDVDGDGDNDLAIGSQYIDSDTSTNVGGVYLFAGPPTGAITTDDSTAQMYTSSSSGINNWGEDGFVGVGDPGDDGYDDMAIGTPYLYAYDYSTYTYSYGGVFILGGAGI